MPTLATETSEEDSKNATRSAEKKQAEQPVKMSWAGLLMPEILQFLIWVPTRVLLKLCVSFRFYGTENLEHINRLKQKNKNQGVIFVANHASELDPIVVRAAMPAVASYTPLYYVARVRSFYGNKNFLEKFIYGGAFFRWWGAYPAYSGFQNYRESLKNHLKLLKKGKSVLIFPEGRTSADGKLGEARGGAGFLVHEHRTPVVPVSIEGAYDLGGRFGFFFGRRKVRVTYGEPLYPEDIFTKAQLETEPTREEYRKASWFILSKTQTSQSKK